MWFHSLFSLTIWNESSGQYETFTQTDAQPGSVLLEIWQFAVLSFCNADHDVSPIEVDLAPLQQYTE